MGVFHVFKIVQMVQRITNYHIWRMQRMTKWYIFGSAETSKRCFPEYPKDTIFWSWGVSGCVLSGPSGVMLSLYKHFSAPNTCFITSFFQVFCCCCCCWQHSCMPKSAICFSVNDIASVGDFQICECNIECHNINKWRAIVLESIGQLVLGRILCW